jgi:DNA-binding LacI/PurR family transcriptional regulator
MSPPAAKRGPYNAKAQRLAAVIAEDIKAGRWRPGEFLPTEHELCARHGVARLTLRRSLEALISRQLLRRIPHRGLLVNHADGSAASAPSVRKRGAATGQAAQRLMIATVCASALDEGMNRILVGIEEYCNAHGLSYQVVASALDIEGPFQALGELAGLGVHGAILLPHPGPERKELLTRLYQGGFPLVCVERRSADLDVPSVEIDNRTGMYRAVHHLFLKYRRPVWYLGLRSSHRNDSDRYEGYRLAMRDAGYADQVDAHTVLHDMDTADPAYWHVEDPWRQGYEVAQKLLKRKEHLMPVACQKDYIAWGLYRAAEEAGLAIGKKIMVTGFDDLSIAERLSPPLTTIRQSFHNKGWKAAWLLHRCITGELKSSIRVMLPTELIVRGST